MNLKSLGQAIQDGDIKFKPWLTKFSPEIFEVDFSNVVKGRGSQIYLDPEEFFKNTFLTGRMKDVLHYCLARTAGLNNRGTVYLATGFGGGKSHLLTLLFHVFNSKQVPDPQLLSELALSNIPDVKIVAVDGHNLTFPIAGSEAFSTYLKATKENTVKALEAEGKPVVILVDELVVYLAKLNDNQKRQEMAHLHTLLSSVNATRNCVIVITNPKGAGVYGKDTETLDALLSQARTSSISEDVSSLLGRVSQPIVPVQKEDFISILRKRLIDYIDPSLASEVESYLGRRLRTDPLRPNSDSHETSTISASTDFTDHYPFHPYLIDVLYNRISLFVDFQETRDALKVIALAIKGILLNPDKVTFYVISPSDFLFSEADLRDLLTNENVFGYDLEQAVTEDVVDAAREADNTIFGRYGRIASAVYMYSLHPEPSKRGASVEEVFHCLTDVVSEGDLEKLLQKFYSDYSTFMWFEEGKYLFKSRQNVPNMIKTRANQVTRTEIQKYIEDTLFSTVFTKASDTYCVFYRADSFTPTSNRLNVAVPLYYEDTERVTQTVLSINAAKKNAAAVFVPDRTQQGTVEYYSKYVLGAERVKRAVKGDKLLFTEAKKLGDQYEAQGLQQFKGMYTVVKFLQGTAVRETAVQPMKGSTVKDALLNRLRTIQKLVDVSTINPKNYLEPLLGTRKAVQVRVLFENVESMASIPYASRNEVRKIVSQGVYEGCVGLFRGAIPDDDSFTGRETIHYRNNVAIVNDGDTVLPVDNALELLEKIRKLQKPGYPLPPGPPSPGPTGGGPPPTPEPPGEEYERESFVADAGELHGILNDKLTMLLLGDVEARAEVVFTGSLSGRVTAGNLEEIRSIVDLADGLAKASSLLGGVKVTVTLDKKVKQG
ncbi:MAG: DUF499 domain-containing protein [Candidatus Bathyarchaeota archaeon]|nr:DUF499 domain-containing protein [Candidatus Bathyarchaeota archaeon]